MKLMLKFLTIIVISITITSCSSKVNDENVSKEIPNEVSTESNEDNSIVSGTFGSDGAFTSDTVNIEVSENMQVVNELTYEDIYNDFIFHSTDPIANKNLYDETNLLEQFIDKNNKLGKFYIQKILANYIFYYYSNTPEGVAEKEYILFDKNTFTAKDFITQFEKDKPEFSKNNNYKNDFISNIYLLDFEKNTVNDLPKYSGEVDTLIKNLYTRKSNSSYFDNESTNSINLFFIFELSNSKNQKTVCTLILPNKISLYAMDADYGSSYDDFYKNSTDSEIKANLPVLSTIVGKIQAFTSFYTTCISI